MGDLSDEELALLGGDDPGCECIFCRSGAEIRRHRAMVKRLEAWTAGEPIERLREALSIALREVEYHNREYKYVTPTERTEAWRALLAETGHIVPAKEADHG